MPIFKKFFERVAHPSKQRQPVTTSEDLGKKFPSCELPGLTAQMGYQKLEPRQVLSASFTFADGLLSLNGFEANQDLTFSEDAGNDVFVFEIGGPDDWEGIVEAGISFAGTTLEVDRGLLTDGVAINGENTIGITQGGSFAISNFTISNFSLNDQSIDLNIDGNLQAGGLTVNDTLPAGPDASILLTATGTIDVTGNLEVLGGNLLSVISLSATGATSDVNVDVASITTDAGGISLTAADAVTLSNAASVQAGLAGSVSLTANSDDATAVGATESILISDGSTISSATGNINLSAIGADGEDITLGLLSTTGDVSISATGDVIDGTAAEIANVIGTRADITAASMGALDDIDIQVQNLSFNSTGAVNITDLANGVTVDATSSAGSGSLIANSPLTISADVNLAGSFVFTAGDSAVVGDHLTVNNNAIITLTAATNETLDFIAGDDLIFDTGSIVTEGGGVHLVNLTADNEGAIDADRGSVTNTAGAVTTVTTNNLVVNAAAGVGASANGLRTAVDSLTVTNTVSGDVFICEADGIVLAGVSNVGRNIAIAAGGFINMTGAINAGAGDVRLVADGDVFQTAAGIITANELGVRQIATVFAAGDDLDANNRFDIVLDAANDVEVFAAANGFDGGVIAMVDVDDLTIGSISAVSICSDADFDATTGVTTTLTGAVTTGAGDVSDGDVLLNAGGFLQLNESISAGAGLADVRLVADGLISQAVAGVIIANELGVRQETIGHIDLCEANNVDVAAMFNNQGDIHFQEVDGYLIGDVSAQTIDGVTFAATTAFLTNDGNISFFSTGSFELTGDVTATTVRIIASGDVTQTAGSVIIADNLGVRQEGLLGGDILLGDANNIGEFAAVNLSDGGVIVFNNDGDLTIGSVTAFAFCGHVFAETTGVVTTYTIGLFGTGEVLLNAGGFLQLNETISAGAGLADVRLVADGDIHQSATAGIVANELGVRQEATVFTAGDDLPVANARFDVILDGVNDIDRLAISNAFDGGLIAFNNSDSPDVTIQNLMIAAVSGQVIVGVSFGATTGIVSTYTGAVAEGAGDVADGDILITTDGYLQLEEAVAAGAGSADVRLTATGDIVQSATGTITANELGIRQTGTVFDANRNLVTFLPVDSFDVILEQGNDVDFLAISNASEAGLVVFNDVDDLTIAAVSAQTIDGASFASTTGLTTTFTGFVDQGAGDVVSGDILVNADGFLRLDAAVSAGAGSADVRLMANGDIHQSATAGIFADELGVRQEAILLDSDNDLDSNSRFDVILGGVNDLAHLAISNDFDGGMIAFNNNDFPDVTIQNLTITSVTSQVIGGVSFGVTTGIVSTFTGAVVEGAGDVADGDILITTDGFLQLEEAVNAGTGTADVRLTASGDVVQSASGTITADELGIRQTGTAFDANRNLVTFLPEDAFDVVLEHENFVDFLAISNESADGLVAFNDESIAGFISIAVVSAQSIDGASFDNTTGINADRLVLRSLRSITNTANAQIFVNQVQFDAPGNDVFIGNQEDDLFELRSDPSGEIILGVVARDASIAAESSLELNGNVPVAAIDINRPLNMSTDDFDLGTAVSGTLFATSTGHIEQTLGSLNAVQLGLGAANHVHLNSVSALNQRIAIEAGDSTVANPATFQVFLDDLAAVPKNEVNATLSQSISVVHQGVMTIGEVENPDATAPPLPDFVPVVVGVSTEGVQDGSVLLVADTSIAINRDVMATATATAAGELPQITIYVQTGAANDPSQIIFGGGSLIVSGTSTVGETNFGVVNDSQTTAFFGIDTNADGVIDLVLPGTTETVRASGGSAQQFIQGQYGSPGEAGYRLAFVWDSQRRFQPGFIETHEIPNLYTSNSTADSELFDVTISNQDAVVVPIEIAGAAFTFETELVESQFLDGGVFNFNTVFVKQDPFTQNAINVRFGDLRVFTTIEVRNDQDINLFVGPLGLLDNSLNSATFVLEAALETTSFQAMQPNQVFFINTILPEPETVEPPRQIPFIPVFEEREYRRLDDPGTLSYVAVKIGLLDEDDDSDPAEFIIEIDGELILKDPTADYRPLDEDAKPETLDANKNEIAAIIEQIEADPNAEAGLWYKIFIDYEDGSGKKDKVLFYHFKTGERPSEELGPASDFEDSTANSAKTDASSIDLEAELELKDSKQPNSRPESPTDPDDSELPADTNNETGALLPAHSPRIETTSDSLAATSRLGLSAGTLLLVSMAAKRNQQSVGRPHAPSQQADSEIQADWGFSRFDRLKRRVAALMGRE